MPSKRHAAPSDPDAPISRELPQYRRLLQRCRAASQYRFPMRLLLLTDAGAGDVLHPSCGWRPYDIVEHSADFARQLDHKRPWVWLLRAREDSIHEVLQRLIIHVPVENAQGTID